MVKLGRIDINMEISILASNLVLLREGNLEAVLHVFLYLWSKNNSRLALDLTYMEIDHERFKKQKWVESYDYVKEAIPTEMPDPRSKSLELKIIIDSNHARDKATYQ